MARLGLVGPANGNGSRPFSPSKTAAARPENQPAGSAEDHTFSGEI